MLCNTNSSPSSEVRPEDRRPLILRVAVPLLRKEEQEDPSLCMPLWYRFMMDKVNRLHLASFLLYQQSVRGAEVLTPLDGLSSTGAAASFGPFTAAAAVPCIPRNLVQCHRSFVLITFHDSILAICPYFE